MPLSFVCVVALAGFPAPSFPFAGRLLAVRWQEGEEQEREA